MGFNVRKIFPLGLLLCMAALAQEPGGHRDPELGVTFPARLGMFFFVEPYFFDDPDLGYSLEYRSREGSIANIYVYDLGMRDIPGGAGGLVVHDQLDQASADIETAVDQGSYLSADQFKPNVQFGNEFLSRCYMIIRADKLQYRSCLFLRGHGGRFIKVRVSGSDRDLTERFMQQFVSELAKVLLSEMTA